MVGVSRARPELGLDAILNDAGRAMVADVGKGCLTDWLVPYAFRRIAQYTTVPDPLALPQVQAVMAAESLGSRRPAGSHYVYWAKGDELNPISEGDALVASYCEKAVAVEYHREPIGEHITLVATGAAGALDYLADRVAGEPAPSTCPPVEVEALAARRAVRVGGDGRARIRLRNPNPFPVELERLSIFGPGTGGRLVRRTVPVGFPAERRRSVRIRVPAAHLRALRDGRARLNSAVSAPGGGTAKGSQRIRIDVR